MISCGLLSTEAGGVGGAAFGTEAGLATFDDVALCCSCLILLGSKISFKASNVTFCIGLKCTSWYPVEDEADVYGTELSSIFPRVIVSSLITTCSGCNVIAGGGGVGVCFGRSSSSSNVMTSGLERVLSVADSGFTVFSK